MLKDILFEEVVEDSYRKFGLFLDEYPNTYVRVEDFGDYDYINFNSGGFLIESLFYSNRKLFMIKNIETFSRKGEGFARRMLLATEKIAKDNDFNISFLLHNSSPSFWKHLGYEMGLNDDLKQTVKGLYLETFKCLTYKKLR